MVSRTKFWCRVLFVAGTLASIAHSFSISNDSRRAWLESSRQGLGMVDSSKQEDGTSENDQRGRVADENDKNPGLLQLAKLSLKDYNWRTSIFKETEADRLVEESLARMMGDEPAYIRPMDASEKKIGPLVSLHFLGNLNRTLRFGGFHKNCSYITCVVFL